MPQVNMVLCTDIECRFIDADLRRLRQSCRLEVSDSHALAALLPKVVDADVLVTSCFAQVPASLIAAGRRLRRIVKCGVGVDNIDLAAAYPAVWLDCSIGGANRRSKPRPTTDDGTVARMQGWPRKARRATEKDRLRTCFPWLFVLFVANLLDQFRGSTSGCFHREIGKYNRTLSKDVSGWGASRQRGVAAAG